MADELKIDLDELERLWKNLLAIDNSFTGLDSVARHLSEAVGHRGLGEAIERFESGWDIQREKIIKTLDTLWQTTSQVEKAFRETEQGLTDVLTSRA